MLMQNYTFCLKRQKKEQIFLKIPAILLFFIISETIQSSLGELKAPLFYAFFINSDAFFISNG